MTILIIYRFCDSGLMRAGLLSVMLTTIAPIFSVHDHVYTLFRKCTFLKGESDFLKTLCSEFMCLFF